MTELTITIPVKVVENGDRHRLVLAGFSWDASDAYACAHGVKLRWRCDDCEEHFGEDGGHEDVE